MVRPPLRRRPAGLKPGTQPLPPLKYRPSMYCPQCLRAYRAGNHATPKTKSRRSDGLCAKHAPAHHPSPPLKYTPSMYCPQCLGAYRAGNPATPKRKSRRSDGLCPLHAPKEPSPTALPRTRTTRKTTPPSLPKLKYQPSTYCPRCLQDYRLGRNDAPTTKGHSRDGLCEQHAPQDALASSGRKRPAPRCERTQRKRWRLRAKSPRSALHTRAYRQCADVGCSLRARAGTRCKKHHRQRLSGIPGICDGRRCLEEHTDATVPKHCLNNATAMVTHSVSEARVTIPHVCAEARFQHTCPNERCRAQYFPEESAKQHNGATRFTLCCMCGKYSNLDLVPPDNADFPDAVAQRYGALLSNTHFLANIRRYNAALAFASFYDNGGNATRNLTHSVAPSA